MFSHKKCRECKGDLERITRDDLTKRQKEKLLVKIFEYKNQGKIVKIRSYHRCKKCSKLYVDWIRVTPDKKKRKSNIFSSIAKALSFNLFKS